MFDRITGTGKWLRIVCAVAFLCIGFAHAPRFAGQPQSSALELAHFAFPDGSLPVLCLSDDEGGGDAGLGKGCEACLLTADLVVPLPGDAAQWLSPPVRHDIPRLRFEAFGRYSFPPNASPRAPPADIAA